MDCWWQPLSIMKKIFALITAALVGLCSYAAEGEYVPCPSTLNLSLVNGEDPSQVEIELQLVNSSSYLVGFNMTIKNNKGFDIIKWNKIGNLWLYFNIEDYLNDILYSVDVPNGVDITDPEFYTSYIDVKAYVFNDHINIKELLWVPYGIFFPICEEPMAVGRFSIDMSDCPDGEYELRSDISDTNASAHYRFPQGYHIWGLDQPLELTLVKEGNTVIELRSIPATFAPEYSSISTIAADENVDNRFFDIQGRELKTVPEHGIYIQNGKKFIAK